MIRKVLRSESVSVRGICHRHLIWTTQARLIHMYPALPVCIVTHTVLLSCHVYILPVCIGSSRIRMLYTLIAHVHHPISRYMLVFLILARFAGALD